MKIPCICGKCFTSYARLNKHERETGHIGLDHKISRMVIRDLPEEKEALEQLKNFRKQLMGN